MSPSSTPARTCREIQGLAVLSLTSVHRRLLLTMHGKIKHAAYHSAKTRSNRLGHLIGLFRFRGILGPSAAYLRQMSKTRLRFRPNFFIALATADSFPSPPNL